MNKNAIEIQNLQKSYHGTTAVDIQKLTIRQGEIYGFLGPNGAGKSTTMKMILSLSIPMQEIFASLEEKLQIPMHNISAKLDQ